MKKTIVYILLVLLMVGIGWKLFMPVATPIDTAPLEDINVKAGNVVSSPLTVTGKAPGPWYFEASFPVALLDASGNEIARVPAKAQDDWMTPNSVPFAVKLSFTPPISDTGTLILEKDNPSGLAENSGAVRIPIRFR